MSSFPSNWRDLTLAALDVETTGLKAEVDRIIEVGIVRFEKGVVVERYNMLIDPECPLPDVTTEITGITEDDLKGQPKFKDVAEEVFQRIVNVGIVAYNLEFDKGFISKELERAGLVWPVEAPLIDPLTIARHLIPGRGNKKLGQMCERFGVPLENAHRAMDDAEAAGHLLYKMADAFKEDIPEELEALLHVLEVWRVEHNNRFRFRNTRRNTGFSQSIAVGLGNSFIYGTEADPLRALYSTVPEASNSSVFD